MAQPNSTIEGVVCWPLATHPDERGFFRELIRSTDSFFGEGFGQLSHSQVRAGVVKAWHLHRLQIDWWYVVGGLLRAGLYDTRTDSPTQGRTMELLLGEDQPAQILKIPPGVAHGYKVLRGPADVLYITSQTYDPTDELRIPWDASEIGFDWQSESEIAGS